MGTAICIMFQRQLFDMLCARMHSSSTELHDHYRIKISTVVTDIGGINGMYWALMDKDSSVGMATRLRG
jgi:hypothetical protein